MLSKGGGVQAGGLFAPFSHGRSVRAAPKSVGLRPEYRTGAPHSFLDSRAVLHSAQLVKDTSVTPCRYPAVLYPSPGAYGIAVIHTTT